MSMVLTAKHKVWVASIHPFVAFKRRQGDQWGYHLHMKTSLKSTPIISLTPFAFHSMSWSHKFLTFFILPSSFSRTILMAGYHFCCTAQGSLSNQTLDPKTLSLMCILPHMLLMLPNWRWVRALPSFFKDFVRSLHFLISMNLPNWVTSKALVPSLLLVSFFFVVIFKLY